MSLITVLVEEDTTTDALHIRFTVFFHCEEVEMCFSVLVHEVVLNYCHMHV